MTLQPFKYSGGRFKQLSLTSRHASSNDLFFQFLRHILYLGGGGALKCKVRPSASHAHPTLEHGALRRMLCYKGALPRLQGPKVGTIGRVLSVDLSSHNSGVCCR